MKEQKDVFFISSLYALSSTKAFCFAGIGTILNKHCLTVAGFHRASPSTTLNKRILYLIN